MRQNKEEITTWWNEFVKKNKTSKVMRSQKVAGLIVKNAYEVFRENILRSFGNVSVLELGCGTGVFSEYLSRENKIKKLVCTDISPEAIKICKQKRLPAQVADAEKLKFKDKSFDVVCGFEILHHLNNPGKVIREACRVSKNFVFFNEPNKWNPIRRLMERFYYEDSAHETSYSASQYEEWFKGIDFSLRIIPYNFLIPYFSNDSFTKFNIFADRLLNRLPTKFIGASLAIIARSKSL